MKAFGGCGYGIFEASQDLVGYEPLCMMQCIDPDLFADLFLKIGDLWCELWMMLLLLIQYKVKNGAIQLQ